MPAQFVHDLGELGRVGHVQLARARQGDLAALDDAGISTATISVSPADPSAADAGDAISVEVRVNYGDVELLGLGGLMPLPTSLRGQASMVKEPES